MARGGVDEYFRRARGGGSDEGSTVMLAFQDRKAVVMRTQPSLSVMAVLTTPSLSAHFYTHPRHWSWYLAQRQKSPDT